MASAADGQPPPAGDLDRLFRPLDQARGIALAVSGGSDSMALMLLFSRWADARPGRRDLAIVFTVDHGLRPEAAAEAAHVAAEARRLGLRHRILTWDGVKPRSNLQHAARTARYRLLAAATEAEGFDTLVTAHTRTDQAETFLLALARGSGVYGLAAMPQARPLAGVRLVRPLLGLSRVRLAAILTDAGLGWSEDPSNDNARYDRIRLRRAAPMLAGLGLDEATLAATARRLGRAAEAIDRYVDRLIADAVAFHPGGFLSLDLRPWAMEPEEVGLRSLSRLIRALTGAPYPPRLQSLERLRDGIVEAFGQARPMQRTLGGVTATIRLRDRVDGQARLWLMPETGRAGLPRLRLHPGDVRVWDGRIEVALADAAADALTVAALGAEGRRRLGAAIPPGLPHQAVETVAAFWDGDRLAAVPAFGYPGGSAAPPPWRATSLLPGRSGRTPAADLGPDADDAGDAGA